MRAAIDIGTNTVRLLVGEVSEGRVLPQRYFRRITRLGGGSTTEKGLAPEAMERTLSALVEAGEILREMEVSETRAVGTAALRNAVNSARFVEEVRSATGLTLEVIEGEEEARLCARGVLCALEPRPRRSLIFDIGGGSTEFILRQDESTLFHRSYPLGVVALCEKFADPSRQKERIAEVLDSFLTDLDPSGHLQKVISPDILLVGTAGTVTTLAALSLGMVDYDWRRVNNLVLDQKELATMLSAMEGLSVAEREALPGMEKGRGDLIVPGLRIVLAIMDRVGKGRLTVSDFGLLEGILLTLADGAQD